MHWMWSRLLIGLKQMVRSQKQYMMPTFHPHGFIHFEQETVQHIKVFMQFSWMKIPEIGYQLPKLTLVHISQNL